MEDEIARLRASVSGAERSATASRRAPSGGAATSITGPACRIRRAGSARSNTALDTEKDISARALAQIEVLNQQIAALRRQLSALEQALDAAEQKDRDRRRASPISARGSM